MSDTPQSNSGLPQIKAVKVALSSGSSWVQEATKAAEIANDFMFETYPDEHPPSIVVSGCDLYIPAYSVIADTLLRTMIIHSPCSSALTMLVCEELVKIGDINPWKLAVEMAAEKASMDSTDPAKA